MYKVFVNEKKLSLSNTPESIGKNLRYDDLSTIEIALDLLLNTSCPEINIYDDDLEKLWANFSGMFRIIEAAGGIVENKNGEILFIKRLGKWDIPKGKIEKGESLKQAAVREIEEETGLENVDIQRFINTTYHIYKERSGEKILKTTHWFYMKYLGENIPKPQIEEGITEVSWKNTTEAEHVVIGKTFKNIELILQQFWNFSQ